MSKTHDVKIAKWLGFTDYDGTYAHKHPIYGWCELQSYSAKDEVAIALLPELVERGYRVELERGLSPNWCFIIFYWSDNQWYTCTELVGKGDTISTAICMAIVGLIDKLPETT